MEFDGPEFLRPRLRIFLSADIVGSTGLKQSRLGASASEIQKQHTAWFSAIQGFYIVARQAFLKEWNDAQIKWPEKSEFFGDEPVVWKTIGDEVIFVKVVTDYRQVAVILKCWIAALAEMRNFLQEKNSRLNVKSTSWLAGFPVENKEVVVSLSGDNKEIEDYYRASGATLNAHYSGTGTETVSLDFIGPAIDIGFRLAAYADSRKFVLAIGIPYILSLTNPSKDELLPDFDVYYHGSVSLKGVLGGLKYPVFWIDLSGNDSLAAQEDVLTGASPPGRDAVRRYCESFYEEHSAYVFTPFIYSISEQQINTSPDWYKEIHTNLVTMFVSEPSDEPTGEGSTADDQLVGPARSVQDIEATATAIADELQVSRIKFINLSKTTDDPNNLG